MQLKIKNTGVHSDHPSEGTPVYFLIPYTLVV